MNRIVKFLVLNVETEKTIKSTKKLVLGVSLLLMIFSLVMSIMNILDKSWIMLGSTILLALAFLSCFLICVIHYNQKIVEFILGFAIIILFSFYAVFGGNGGFAIDWILIVPIAYVTLFGLLNGLLVGGYFGVFLVVILWTPLYSIIPYTYPSEVRLRFPILYICCFLLAIIIGVRNKKLRISQMRNEEQLSQAVLAERSRVERISMDAVSSICRALDAKDPYTKKHSDNVATYASMIARRIGWNETKIERLERAAKVHDLGKIGIPDSILKKNGALDDEQFSIMKQHVALGYDIVSDFTSMPELAVGAKYHHERYDGNGYSTGLSGEDIPIEGRIIALADSIDAMSHDRVYRKKRSKEFLLAELKNGSGKQFDPNLVLVALELINNGMIEYT